jgi:6-phosphogluconolactonase/glucosamine-6-phosphate isomerase/deaminase
MKISPVEKDQKLQKLILRHLKNHPAKMAEFLALSGGRTPEAYFQEYSHKEDIGDSVASDLNLRFPAKRPVKPVTKGKPAPVSKSFDPFDL